MESPQAGRMKVGRAGCAHGRDGPQVPAVEHNSVGHNTGLGHVWVKGQGLGLVVQSPYEETSQPMWVRDVHLGIVEVSVVIGALGVGQNTGQSSVLGTREPWAECHGLRD